MKGENKKLMTVSVVIILLLSVVILIYLQDDDIRQEPIPIRINGDEDFASQAADEGWPGDGSEEDPYIIEGYEIDGSGHGYGIYIGNTTVHFVVRNCYLHNVSGGHRVSPGAPYGSYRPNFGISLFNVQNGRLVDNELLGPRDIYLYNSTDNTISSNKASANSLFYSDNNTITDNIITVSENKTSENMTGFFLLMSHRNTISNNIILSHPTYYGYNGIGLFDSRLNRIFENNISGFFNGIYVVHMGPHGNNIYNNTFSGNVRDVSYTEYLPKKRGDEGEGVNNEVIDNCSDRSDAATSIAHQSVVIATLIVALVIIISLATLKRRKNLER